MWGLAACDATNNITKNNIAEGFSIQVMKNNTTPKSYKKIMIAGFGTSANRLFFENIYDALSAEFFKANITTEKKFNGDSAAAVVPGLDKLKGSQDNDAVLIVAPQPIGFVTEKNIANPVSTHQFERNFKFAIFDKPGMDTSIWELKLTMNIDFTQAKPCQILAEKILENMRQNKLVQ